MLNHAYKITVTGAHNKVGKYHDYMNDQIIDACGSAWYETTGNPLTEKQEQKRALFEAMADFKWDSDCVWNEETGRFQGGAVATSTMRTNNKRLFDKAVRKAERAGLSFTQTRDGE